MRGLYNILIFYFCVSLFISCKSENDTLIPSSQVQFIDTLLINRIFYNRMDLEMTKISNVSLYGSLNDSIDLTGILSKGPTVILFFSEEACFDCISKQLEYVAEYYRDNIDIPIAIISPSLILRDIYGLMLEKGLDLPYYSTKLEDIGFDRNKHPGPLYFILDDELICKCSYEPFIHSFDLTSHYLTKTNKFFFNN